VILDELCEVFRCTEAAKGYNGAWLYCHTVGLVGLLNGRLEKYHRLVDGPVLKLAGYLCGRHADDDGAMTALHADNGAGAFHGFSLWVGVVGMERKIRRRYSAWLIVAGGGFIVGQGGN
jgi:hypothetical protein